MKILPAIMRLVAPAVLLFVCSCNSPSPVQGKWEYDGGLYNGKPKKADPDFRMQRTYTADSYEAYLIEPGAAPVKYGAGTYEIKADTFKVTSNYSSQPSQSLGKTLRYIFKVEGNRLTITGLLPNGMQVEEYWKKIE